MRITNRLSSYPVWSPDGKHLIAPFPVNDPNSKAKDMVLLDAEKAAEEQRPEILPRSTSGQFLANAWSADGARLVGQIDAVGAAGKGVMTYTFKTKAYDQLSTFGEWPVWLPDNRRILFNANRHDFYVLDSKTKQVRKIFSAGRDVVGPPRLTRDGRFAYFNRRVNEADIWLLTLQPSR
jgi:Tol biopolymer transport system component